MSATPSVGYTFSGCRESSGTLGVEGGVEGCRLRLSFPCDVFFRLGFAFCLHFDFMCVQNSARNFQAGTDLD